MAVLLYISFLALYLITFRGRFSSMDNETSFRVTESIVERGEFSVLVTRGLAVEGRDGKRYGRLGIGYSLAGVPFYLAGRWYSERVHPTIQGNDPRRVFMLLLNPLLTPLICVLLFLFSVELGYSARAGLWTAAAAGLGTLLWPYAGAFYSHAAPAACLLGAAYHARLYARSPRFWRSLVIGVLLGAACTFRHAAVIPAGIVGLYFLYRLLTARGPTPGVKLMHLALSVLTAAPFVVLVLYYSYARFGNALTTGYVVTTQGGFHPTFWPGLYLLVMSSGRSVFLFGPVLLLGVWGWFTFKRRHGAEAALAAGVAGFYLLLHAYTWQYNMDVSYGHRFLIPAMGFLLLPLPQFLEGMSYQSPPRVRGRVFAVFMGLSALATLPGAAVRSVDFHRLALGGYRGTAIRESYWDPAKSPIVGHWGVMLQGLKSPIEPETIKVDLDRFEAVRGEPRARVREELGRMSPYLADRQTTDLGPDFEPRSPRRIDLMLWRGIAGPALDYRCAFLAVVLVGLMVYGFARALVLSGAPPDPEQDREAIDPDALV